MPFNPRQNQWSLGTTMPNGWSPEVIKHYVVEFDGHVGGREIRFKFRSESTKYTGQTIDEVIAKIKASPLHGDEESPLDINSDRQCYIIIELSKNFDWQFSRDGDGITLKDDLSNRYVDLNHVFEVGPNIRGGHSMKPGCRMIYFAVLEPPQNEHPFNLHVDLLYPTMIPEMRLPIVIDPDIKHPGGTN